MKNSIIILIVTMFLTALSSQALAAQFQRRAGGLYQITAGTIVSIGKGSFVVKDKDDGRTYAFTASASDLASLTQGSEVVVTAEHPGSIALAIR